MWRPILARESTLSVIAPETRRHRPHDQGRGDQPVPGEQDGRVSMFALDSLTMESGTACFLCENSNVHFEFSRLE